MIRRKISDLRHLEFRLKRYFNKKHLADLRTKFKTIDGKTNTLERHAAPRFGAQLTTVLDDLS